MTAILHRLVALVTMAALVVAGLQPLGPARAAVTGAETAPMPACDVSDETVFHDEVARLTQTALERGLKDVDYNAAVADAWRKAGLNDLLDALIDKAVAEIRDETAWTDLLKTLASKEAAQKLATSIAERVYRSDTIQKAIEGLAGDVGSGLSGRIELATLDAAGPAVTCVKTFLGSRYGSTISLIVADDTGRQFETSASAGTADVSATDVVFQGKGAVAGTVVLIVRGTLKRMVQRIGQRVVGAVLGKLVSVISGGIGLVLIAKDIWDFRNGVLPIIQQEMKSEDSKEKVREEIAGAISSQLGTHIKELSTTAADRILGVWHDFREAHTKVVELSGKHEPFKQFMDTISPETVPKVDRVVALVLAKEGEEGVIARVQNGSLDEAVKRMPEVALGIAADTQSLEKAFEWSTLAGDRLDDVVRYQLHRTSDPKDFTPAELDRLFTLDDDLAISRLVHLASADRKTLEGFASTNLKPLLKALPPEDLTALATYLQALSPVAAARLFEAVAASPQRMQSFNGAGVRGAIIGSRDQGAAVDMLLRNTTLFDPEAIQGDLARVWAGDIQPLLIWQKYPAAVLAMGLAGLFVLMMMNRLLFWRRKRGTGVGAAG